MYVGLRASCSLRQHLFVAGLARSEITDLFVRYRAIDDAEHIYGADVSEQTCRADVSDNHAGTGSRDIFQPLHDLTLLSTWLPKPWRSAV